MTISTVARCGSATYPSFCCYPTQVPAGSSSFWKVVFHQHNNREGKVSAKAELLVADHEQGSCLCGEEKPREEQILISQLRHHHARPWAWFKSWVFQVTVRTVPVPRRWRFFLSPDR